MNSGKVVREQVELIMYWKWEILTMQGSCNEYLPAVFTKEENAAAVTAMEDAAETLEEFNIGQLHLR